MRNGKVLVTGGAGYIGSTICNALTDAGYTPIILDSLCSGPRKFTEGKIFYEGDIADRPLLTRIFKEQGSIQATIHCAALIVVPESVTHPEKYYRENVIKSLELFASLRDLGCKRVVFSSSASVYDVVEDFMVDEASPVLPASPYARTKYMMELILQDFCAAYDLQGIALRYFNPIGSDPKMRSGAYIQKPTHVLGRMVSVAQGRDSVFEITGTDWPTRDGSGIRDYIHVWDLASAHVKAVENFDRAFSCDQPVGPTFKNYRVINLGTGGGVTVKEFVQAFEKINGKPIAKREAPPRPGDNAGSFANSDTAKKLIDWQPEYNVEDGIRTALQWASIYFAGKN